MDKILERLGLYDLFVNFISGIAMATVIQLLAYRVFCMRHMCRAFYRMEVWQILIMCYFLGVIFQELSNFIETALYRWTKKFDNTDIRNGWLLYFIPSIDRVLLEKGDGYRKKKLKRDLSDWELKRLSNIVKDEILKSDADKTDKPKEDIIIDNYNEVVYHYCKSIALSQDNSRIAHDQSHASMARSLSLFSLFVFFLSGVFALHGWIKSVPLFVITMIVSLCLSALFARRNKRFSELRHVNIFRTVIYADIQEKVIKTKESEKSNETVKQQ